ncbi:MAG: hypothetical protein R3C52_14270 [Hyphomonadaceae bacterium]
MKLGVWSSIAGFGLGAAAIGGAWLWSAGRSGESLPAVERAIAARYEAAAPVEPGADVFRATVCAEAPCLLVEVSGLSFLFGAGKDAAAGLRAMGRLRPDLDAVFLSDINPASFEGLAAIRRATWLEGRHGPLPVYGPPGVSRVVDGVNLMMAGADRVTAVELSSTSLSMDGALLQAPRPAQAPRNGRLTLFDSGVVSVQVIAVHGAAGDVEWLYRVEADGRVLLIAGCGAAADDLSRAAEGALAAAAIVPGVSPTLLKVHRDAAARTSRVYQAAALDVVSAACPSFEAQANALGDARISAALVHPAFPLSSVAEARAGWKQDRARNAILPVDLGEVGAGIEFTAAGASLFEAGQPAREADSIRNSAKN